MRQFIISPNAPRPPEAPLSQAVKSGGFVFVSGITPFTLDQKLAVGDFDAQMRQVMTNLGAVLEASGSSFDRVVRTTVYLARQSDWRRMNEIYAPHWRPGEYPARTAVEAKLPHPDFLIEIECIAEAD